MKGFLMDLVANAIVMTIGLAIVATFIKRKAFAAGKAVDVLLARLLGEEQAEKIEERLIETGLKKFLEGLDADEKRSDQG